MGERLVFPGAKPGLHLFAAGEAWERAYEAGADFLRASEGTLLLGAAVGPSGKAWLEDNSLRDPPLLLGERSKEWKEWVTRRAQGAVLGEGGAFRVMNEPAQREFLREILAKLDEAGVLLHLSRLWPEEKFFDGLLGCVQEARLGGLHELGAIERAKDLLTTGADQVTREAYLDFWNLLLAFETRLASDDDGRRDFPALLRAANLAPSRERDFFLLGFEQLSLLEVDLVQNLARENAVFLPLAIPAEAFAAQMAGKELAEEQLPSVALRGLLTGFAGAVHFYPSAAEPAAPTRPLLVAHAPSEEARAAAALAAQALGDDSSREIRFVLPVGYLEDEPVETAFREELGLGRHFRPRTALSHPIARLFFHALELKDKGYELAHGLEFAQLLSFTLGRFANLPALATRAGVRRGLADWRRKAEALDEPELSGFVEVLGELDRLLPTRGKAAVFAGAAQALAELAGIGELARRAADREIEREAHGALSTLLRNTQMLSVSLSADLSFREWMRELGSLLAKSPLGEERSLYPRLQFARYGEWLPPARAGTVTLPLGFDAGLTPRQGFRFFLEEGARRKLGDFLFPTQSHADLTYLDHSRRLLRAGTVVVFRAHLDSMGGERAPAWAEAALALVKQDAPEVPRTLAAREAFIPLREVRTRAPEVKALSASLLETYKECPYRAFALKILRLEDKMQAASLDVSQLDLGSIVHKALELFYGPEGRGKHITDPAAREALLDRSLQAAVAAQRIEYFKGGDDLLAVQVRRLRRLLLDFLAIDRENYERFPHFADPAVEQVIEGTLGPYAWKGKVDRVDLDPVNKKFLVLDYKIGATTPSSGEVKALERFQLPLYLEAVEKMHPGYEPAGGLYVSLKTGERKQGMVRREFNEEKKNTAAGPRYFGFHVRTGALLPEEEFRALRENSLAEALRLAERLQGGDFPVAPLHEESCARCEARPACRIRELEAPPRQPWSQERPDFLPYLAPAPPAEAPTPKARRFNEEQEDALGREGSLVFIEASAGTGKTTVIVEKIRRFLSARLAAGDPSYRAVERFSAISFTEKSAQELAERVGEALLHEEGMGPRVAAQAIQQISTIHGFCRRILGDFPVEAGLSPLAQLLDPKEAGNLRTEALEEFFLGPPEEAREALEVLFASFPRSRIESFLRRLLDLRLLLREDESIYEEWIAGGTESPAGLVAPEGSEREALAYLLVLGRAFAAVYERLKRERDSLDFNDLEALALKVLEHEHARAYYRERFGLLLVDEFQDTNSVQREILARIAAPAWANLFVVGDAKQSIYRFRNADVSIFQSLRAEAEKRGELVTLFRNYRSRQEVVAAANLVTRGIFPAPGEAAPAFEAVAAEAQAFRASGGRVALVEYGDPSAKLTADEKRAREAEIVAGLVRARIEAGVAPGSIAILLRKISSNEAYLQALTRAGISFRVGSSRGFYGQSVVTDGIALLRALYSPSNDMALLALLRSPWVALSDDAILAIQRRQPPRTPLWECLVPTDAPRLFAWRERAPFLSCSEVLSEAYRHYPLDRREHLQTVKLLSILSGLEAQAAPRVEILERLSLWAGWEGEDSGLDDSTMPEPGNGGAVRVMTVHAAKGLEFDVTVLPDLTGGPQPDRSAFRVVPGVGMALKFEGDEKPAAYDEVGEKNAERELAESKRLLYVAVTRAKEECIFVMPRVDPAAKPGKRRSWADFLRDAGLPAEAERVDGDAAAALGVSAPAGSAPEAAPRERPDLPFRLATSISELAAYQYCGEFHRRKFVQGWDDRVVDLWPRPPRAFQKAAAKATLSEERQRAATLLKKLGIQNKERGIALHRLLERAQGTDLPHGELWLREAYEQQGVHIHDPLLAELVELDLALLERFLSSPVGRELFAEGVTAYPEVPFQWSVHGTVLFGVMDRLLRRADGTWVVVDYKSSILEESRDRYRFQVESYMAAVAEYARGMGEADPRVLGYLVDLYETKAYPVETSLAEAALRIGEEIDQVKGNYTLPVVEVSGPSPGARASTHCFSCAYLYHCDLGKEFVNLPK